MARSAELPDAGAGAGLTRLEDPPSGRAIRLPGWTIAAAVALALAVLVWGGYGGGWTWTGFGDNDTLWDWLQLLLLPVAVAALPVWLRHRDRIGARRHVLWGALLVVAVLVAVGYLLPWPWTGFPGNTLWDWLSLVLLPAAVALAGAWEEVRHRIGTRHRRAAGLGLAVVAALVVVGYVRPWAWTGFPGNTLWDWLQLLLVPLLVPTLLVPAAMGWFGAQVARGDDARGAGPPSRPQPARTASLLAAGAAILAIGGAAGALAFGGHDATAARGASAASAASSPAAACRRPAATVVAADTAARIVRSAGAYVACPQRGTPIRLLAAAAARGAPVVRLGAGRAVVADQRCAGPTAPCRTRIVVTRMADGGSFVRHTFARAGHVTGIAVSPGGALAIMLRDPAQLVLLDSRGMRVAASGPGLDTGSLGSSGRTVYWRFDGRAAAAQMTS